MNLYGIANQRFPFYLESNMAASLTKKTCYTQNLRKSKKKVSISVNF